MSHHGNGVIFAVANGRGLSSDDHDRLTMPLWLPD
jgi:hypothetical protein